jgi:hypothetical protein
MGADALVHPWPLHSWLGRGCGHLTTIPMSTSNDGPKVMDYLGTPIRDSRGLQQATTVTFSVGAWVISVWGV